MRSHTFDQCDLEACGREPDDRFADFAPRWHHRFRQSWLKTSTICLERARLETMHEMPEDESDAANIGTAVHTAIEVVLSEGYLDLSSMFEIFNDAFSELMLSPHWRWVKYNERSARGFGEKCVYQWHTQVLPSLDISARLETKFCAVLLEDDRRVIELSGTIDYFDGVLRDWKTSGGREWQKWEHERWDIQPTIYTWAARKMGWLRDPEPWPFEFVILGGKKAERMPVTRRVGDHIWLQAKCVETAKLIELELEHWPTNDTHALCSPKWCPAWDQCKGKYVAATWPR